MDEDTLIAEDRNRLRLRSVRSRPQPAETWLVRAAQELSERLNREIAEGHDATAFLVALLLAASKDGLDWILDFMLIGEVPIVGQVPGVFLSAFLAYFLWRKGWFNKTKIRIAYYALGLFVDNLPLFNNLPLNVLLVLWAWHVVRKRAAEAHSELGELKRQYGKVIHEAT